MNTNKTVLITGGSRGIGKAMVYAFAKAGYNVMLNFNRSESSANEIAKEFENVKIYGANVADQQSVINMVNYTYEVFGNIDILINNAGISYTGLLQDMSIDEWNNLMSVNLTGPYNLCKAVLPRMIANKSGKIINISSVWGITGASCEAAYSASKAGVIGLTKALAKEVGPSNIKVNCIAPGIVMTDMISDYSMEELNAITDEIPLGKIGSTEDIAKTALFLASDDADYITGQVISPNGGWVI
ncbi:MAG: SDR family oxidoreductase [Clostridia bacterium]|nr:SDR family oxidoreductase [Clostridia bacterium]